MMHPAAIASVGLALAGLAACGAADEAGAPDENFAPDYRGAEVRVLDAELIQVLVAMKGARGIADVEDHARCVAAGQAQARGQGFLRHLRTNVARRAGLWQGDAIYTMSAALPRGLRTIDAAVTVRDCRKQGIPTI